MRARTTTTNSRPSGAMMRSSSFGRASGGTWTIIRMELSDSVDTCGGMNGIGMPSPSTPCIVMGGLRGMSGIGAE